jgi:hypothetical protein
MIYPLSARLRVTMQALGWRAPWQPAALPPYGMTASTAFWYQASTRAVSTLPGLNALEVI